MIEGLTKEQNVKIRIALADGQKIKAIKVVREATGKDLKDSKEAVEALIGRLMEQDPTTYAKLAQGGSGCASVFVLGLGMIGTMVTGLLQPWG